MASKDEQRGTHEPVMTPPRSQRHLRKQKRPQLTPTQGPKIGNEKQGNMGPTGIQKGGKKTVPHERS